MYISFMDGVVVNAKNSITLFELIAYIVIRKNVKRKRKMNLDTQLRIRFLLYSVEKFFSMDGNELDRARIFKLLSDKNIKEWINEIDENYPVNQ
jgi:hypothetical protein